jgi:hypothetical protein
MRFFRDNGLSIALIAVFLLCFIGMVWAGWLAENAELMRHGRAGMDVVAYVFSADFSSALFENWESEFLQMSAYVIMTAMLFQRGSSESKDPDREEPEDADPALRRFDPHAPWPVRAGGLVSALYSYSLGIVLLGLFVLSFVFHWLASVRVANQEAALHGGVQQTALAYLADPQMWFESFQNWQSEFLATAVLVVLSIFLRYRGSPESKPVAAAHAHTGR